MSTVTECPSCAAPASVLSAVGSHVAPFNGVRYTRRACAQCRLQFWDPLRADPAVYESEGYHAYEDYHRGERPFPRWAEPLFHLPSLRPGRSLDIGCADGEVMARLRARGFDVYGIDLDQASVAVARDKHGLASAEVATLDDYVSQTRAQGQSFDLVTFFEVLEHQDNPRAFLQQARSLLAPDGVVAGSVPNRKRFLSTLDRKLGEGDLPPHHFLWFSATALKALLDHGGFSSIEVKPVGAVAFGPTHARVKKVLRRLCQRPSLFVRLAAAAGLLMSPLLSLVLYLGYRSRPPHLFFSCRVDGGKA